jgi:sulfate transport system ATP-binding protein
MSIVLDQLLKRYEGQSVVNNVSLTIEDGEFFVLLGASGSGKSTILRMIAGLTPVDGGKILLHGRDVTHVSPQRRQVGFVFQHYALFKHLTVAENIEFGLQVRKVPAAERKVRRDELLELVGLAGLGKRMPRQLSGGQQQRVALARALAHKPEVLLLDEPFGALDARIRLELRRTIRAIQRELKVTAIFVTHDQEEAFELADRMGVLNFGRLLEVGRPEELYLRPQTEYVATFLGAANLMVGDQTRSTVRLGHVEFPLATQAAEDSDHHRVQILFRPEDVAVKDSPDALGWPLLGEGEVEESSFVGSYERIRLRLPAIARVRAIAPPAPFGGDSLLVDAVRSQYQARRYPLGTGQKVWVGVRRVHALTHPGLNILLPTDGSQQSDAALATGKHLARLASARVTVLGYGLDDGAMGTHLRQVREKMGSGLASLDCRQSPAFDVGLAMREIEPRQYDLVILGRGETSPVPAAERLLDAGARQVLLVPKGSRPPERVLFCVALGEPSKNVISVGGRVVRHLGASVTLLAVLPEEHGIDGAEHHAERFLAAGKKTLSFLGVPADSALRRGAAQEQIAAEVQKGNHDLVVVGAPLADDDGHVSLDGFVGRLLDGVPDRPVMIVRPL